VRGESFIDPSLEDENTTLRGEVTVLLLLSKLNAEASLACEANSGGIAVPAESKHSVP
jgi:hypothetical protein